MCKRIVCLALSAWLAGCGPRLVRLQEGPPQGPPPVQREFRAAWVATVANIDWPSEPGLPADTQKAEALAILDSAAALKLNAIIFQVRPQCDALYASSLEPWSYYLTGEQGVPPEPFYDPLSFWVDEAHARGLELHAWFNPYRAHHPAEKSPGDSSIARLRPDLVRQVEGGYYWLDPAMQEVQDYSFEVVMDVVRRYDIDGVHFDDYFYPYGDGSFPDDGTWAGYRGRLSREDWRREAVNTFIQRVYKAIKNEKKYVKFGLSPFGIWRPHYPASIRGFDQYSLLYADARLWLNKGWVDYWTPQLYWPVNQIPQSFPVLLGWWDRENLKNRHLWPGMYTSRAAGEKGHDEIQNQIMICRGFVPEAPGHVHFSMKPLLENRDSLASALKLGVYRTAALVPSTPWLDDTVPGPPQVSARAEDDTLRVEWTHADTREVFLWVVQIKMNGQWQTEIKPRRERSLVLPLVQAETVKTAADTAEPRTVFEYLRAEKAAVTAVSRTGNSSVTVIQNIRQ